MIELAESRFPHSRKAPAMNVRWMIPAATMLVLCVGSAVAKQTPTSGAQPFGSLQIRFEQNATDQDVEVVFELVGDRNGLVQLTAVAPDGRTVIDFKAPAGSVGLRQFRFESPEPRNVASLKTAYPAGVYHFSGTTSAGVKLQGETSLSHTLPAAATFVRPALDAEGVSTESLEISWKPVPGLEAYIVSVEQEETNHSIVARLPASATRFTVPSGFLAPNTEYKLAIGTVTQKGNGSFVETTIKTGAAGAAKK
jgi:hypothetical protein